MSSKIRKMSNFTVQYCERKSSHSHNTDTTEYIEQPSSIQLFRKYSHREFECNSKTATNNLSTNT